MMASRWQKKLSRLTRMDGKEIRTRAGQEVSKRLDLALYHFGLRPWENRSYSRSFPTSRFFFGENNDAAADRAVLLRQHMPGEVKGIIEEADRICRHEFSLLGYEKLDYGPNIDWHCDPVHGKRSPLKPWFKINYLDFHEVGDHKIIWELNRHQHLVALAKARLLTGDQIYTNELTLQWYSWVQANAYPLGINWASALEVAFRSLSWLWVRNLLAGCAELSAGFEADLLVALQLHGRYIERYLSTYFSPNTHLIGEAVALFFIGTLCPQISAAERWRNTGWRIILEESKRQLRPDGVYFEQALYYHVYALDFFQHARLLASENGHAIPESFDNTLRKMLEVVDALSKFGPIEGFGDDDGGRVFNPRRNRVEHMTDPLAVGSILYDRHYPASGLTEEAIWLFGDKAVEVHERRVPTPGAPRAFKSAGIYLIDDDGPCAQQMMIDAGQQETGRSGHGHADALSIRLSVGGYRFLIDPGTYCYISDGKDRDSFRGTGAHNTLRVDELDQAVPDGPFAWSSIPNVEAETWLNGQTFDFFAGRHDGYSRLPNLVLHRRFVFHVKGGFWVVRDVAEGHGSHLLESLWHFAPQLEVREEERGLLLVRSPASEKSAERIGIALLFDQQSDWKTEVGESFVSPAYGSKQPGHVLRASIHAELPAECAVLTLPASQAAGIGTFAAISDRGIRGVRGYRYQTTYSAEFLFFADADTSWTCGLWSSDAKFVYCKLQANRCTHVIMVEGSFAEWDGRRFVSHPAAVESYEWSDSSGSVTRARTTGGFSPDALVNDFVFFDSVT